MLQKNDVLARAPITLTLDKPSVGNKVLRNTYLLLSMTLLFSAVTAGIAMATNAAPLHWLITMGGISWPPGNQQVSTQAPASRSSPASSVEIG